MVWSNSKKSEISIYNEYQIIDVNHKRHFNKYKPFVMGSQAT